MTEEIMLNMKERLRSGKRAYIYSSNPSSELTIHISEVGLDVAVAENGTAQHPTRTPKAR